jgi:DHA3 family tetracycline resistance protein-like MFS transporter
VNNKRAYRAYLIMEGGMAFFFALVFTVSAIYRIQTVGLDPLQLVLVGTMLEVTYFLFEVPTGVVADTFSRRLSVIIGVFVIGLGIGLEGVIPTFAAVMLGQIISGIGYTFISGATEAWIADEVGEEHLPNVFMRSSQVGQAAGMAGVIASVIIGSFQIGLPIILGGSLMMALALLLWVLMPETGFNPTPRENRTNWQAMRHTFREGTSSIRRQPRLLTFLLIASFFGMTSEAWDRLMEAHFILNIGFPEWGGFQPVVWLGAMSIAGGLMSIGATEIARRRINMERRETVVRTVAIFTGLRIASVLLFAFAGNFATALVGRWGKSIFASVAGPLYNAWLNQSIESRVRATVLSITGQADSIGQIVGGPVFGAVGKFVSVQASIALSGFLLAPVLLLFGRAHRQGNDAEEAVAVTATSEA